MPRLSLGTCLLNSNSVALTVLELLAFNAKNGVTSPCHPPFRNVCHVRTVPGNEDVVSKTLKIDVFDYPTVV